MLGDFVAWPGDAAWASELDALEESEEQEEATLAKPLDEATLSRLASLGSCDLGTMMSEFPTASAEELRQWCSQVKERRAADDAEMKERVREETTAKMDTAVRVNPLLHGLRR